MILWSDHVMLAIGRDDLCALVTASNTDRNMHSDQKCIYAFIDSIAARAQK